jgi:hypothetical protein
MTGSRHWSVPIVAMALLWAAWPAAGQTENQCSKPTQDYKGWTVADLNVTSPLGYFAAVAFGFSGFRDTLLLQHEKGFDPQQYHAGVEFINTAVTARIPAGFTTLRVVVTVDHLENCVEATRTLKIHYVVYTAIVPSLSGKSFEQRQANVERPSTAGATTSSSGRLLTIPSFAYDHTRHGIGGGLIQSQAPLGIFDSIKIDTSASSNSLLGDLALSGQRTPAWRSLNQGQWQLAGVYRDIPTGAQNLKEGTLAASFFASSRELTAAGLLFNYGASLAGGHQQSTAAGAPNSSYGALKFVAGAQGRWGPSALAGAYGIQLGSTLTGRTIDFAKHIVDLRYSAVFTPMPSFREPPCHPGAACDDRTKFIGAGHRPFSLEARATGGLIQQFGVLPSVERFFGGNQQNAPFIDGEPWDVRGQPYIRSIPAYQLGSANPAFGLGGTRFYSLNLTFAKAVVSRAILPKELGTQDFVDKLTGAVKSATGMLSDTYFGKDPAVQKADSEVTAIGVEVDKLTAQLAVPVSFDSATNKRISPILAAAKLHAKLVSSIVTSITVKGNRNSVLALFTLVPSLDSDLTLLRNALTAASQPTLASTFGDRQTAIDAALQQLSTVWKGTAAGTVQPAIQEARKRADAHADEDLKPARTVLDTVLYQLNAYSVAPVGIFDIARVWPSGVGTRYGIGGGVRLSLVNANFTIGYAFNPQPRQDEGHGALFLKLDITDIFH